MCSGGPNDVSVAELDYAREKCKSPNQAQECLQSHLFIAFLRAHAIHIGSASHSQLDARFVAPLPAGALLASKAREMCGRDRRSWEVALPHCWIGPPTQPTSTLAAAACLRAIHLAACPKPSACRSSHEARAREALGTGPLSQRGAASLLPSTEPFPTSEEAGGGSAFEM